MVLFRSVPLPQTMPCHAAGRDNGVELRQHRRGNPVPPEAVRAADDEGPGSRCGADLRAERSQRAIEGQTIFQGEMR